MTGEEMVFSFQELLIAVSNKFEEEEKVPTYEILDYLNRTVHRYIKLKYLSGNTFKTNAFKIAQSPDDLGLLITNYSVAATGTPYPGIPHSEIFNTPADFLAYIRSSTGIIRTKPEQLAHAGTELIPNIEIDFNDIDNLVSTAYNKPILVYPAVTLASSDPIAKATVLFTSLVVITDSYSTIQNISLDYIRDPKDISVTGDNCELATFLHEEIVKLAVSLYLDEYKLKLSGTQQTR